MVGTQVIHVLRTSVPKRGRYSYVHRMSFETPEVVKLANGEIAGPIMVGRTSEAVARALTVPQRWVWLTRDTLSKQLSRHPEMPIGTYEDMSWVLESRMVIPDPRAGRLHLIATAQTDELRYFKCTIKHTQNSERLFLLSAHMLRPRSFNRLVKRAGNLSIEW